MTAIQLTSTLTRHYHSWGFERVLQPDPEVVRRMAYEGLWAADRPFPLTLLKA